MTTSAAELSPAGGVAALDLHEEVLDPAGSGCRRFPENLRLVSSNGEVVRGRCSSPNRCDYCARLAAVQTSEMLALDALQGDAPELWAVLTTSRPIAEPAHFYEARRAVVKALKRRWPSVEYCAVLEFTTGYGPLAGGKRRPHWNLLLKGIPARSVDEASAIVTRVWCSRREVGAKPQGQYVGKIEHSGGLMRYLALHFQKAAQAPPAGWRGHRVTRSRGFLTLGTEQTRRLAREALTFKRDLWRAVQAGSTALQAEDHARRMADLRERTSWRLTTTAAKLSQDEDGWHAVRAYRAQWPQSRRGDGPHRPKRSSSRFASWLDRRDAEAQWAGVVPVRQLALRL